MIRTIVLLFILFFSMPSVVDAQLFGRSSTAAYGETSWGYQYRGRSYVRGKDLPDNPSCMCPMCVDLRNAYYAARSSNQQYTPQVSSNASTSLIGTPPEVVDKIVDIFKPDKEFVLLDPGCGDARILIKMCEKYGCRGIGVEINPETYQIALRKVKEAGLDKKITIINGDSRDYSFANVDGVVMFLFPDLIEELTKKFGELKTGVKVVSYSHDIPLEDTVNFDEFYVWTKRE